MTRLPRLTKAAQCCVLFAAVFGAFAGVLAAVIQG